MEVEHLYRYPVKGLTAEALDEAELEAGAGLPWDRAFALAQGDAPFDPAAPEWLPKSHFMCLMCNARIAALRAGFDPPTGTLSIRGPDGAGIVADALSQNGRARIGAFLAAFLGDEARGTPRLHHVPGHVFQDQRRPVVSLINLASLHAYEKRCGVVRDRMRFRANIYFSGAPWSEFDWIDRQVQVGKTRLQILKRIARCPATQVNPGTAKRDADPVSELRAAYGHSDLGVHALVLEGGKIALGDAIEVLPP
ncbi:MAG: MOSC domain-containing protein [Acidisphaera sp.]|nr:MOSC domain-containing protein [Acidisphaera sp.]